MSSSLFVTLIVIFSLLFYLIRLNRQTPNITSRGHGIARNDASSDMPARVRQLMNTGFVNNRLNDRLTALNEASIYLSPYNNIWRNLKLSNKYCYLFLGNDGISISGSEKVYPHRSFRVVSAGIYKPDELWNMWCRYFDFNKSYDGLLEDCRRFGISIIENEKTLNDNNNTANNFQHSAQVKPIEKLDINNCSEVELTALPGISIVISKKIVKRREEIGGFKSLEEFFGFIKLRPHMENQLRELIEIKKMKGSLKKRLNEERSVDL